MTPEKSEQTLSPAFIRLWLFLLIAVGAAIRLWGANYFHYSADEAMHANIAKGFDLAEVLSFSHYEIHPPLLYILTHYWMSFSYAPAFVRCLPLIFGLLLIPLYYRIGHKLNGEMTGLCCAALIAFSNGCIIQSYVVRQYIFLIFFFSLAYERYLNWRETGRMGTLAAYSACATLACLFHFSGIFCIACLGLYHFIGMARHRAPLRSYLPWILANAVPGLIAIAVYLSWRPILVPLQSYFATHTTGTLASRLIHTLFYPLVTSGYVLPGYASALILLLAQVWVVIAPPHFIRNLPGLRSLLGLTLIAYGLGMFLVITRLYPEPGTRHSMWVLPFVLPAAGWILADSCRWLASLYPGKPLPLSVMAACVMALGIVTYSPATRFSDGSEYVWPQEQWEDFARYLQKLNRHDIIITEKDDGIMFANLYRVMGDDAFSGRAMATLTDYSNLHIVFNPYYPRNYSRHLFMATLLEADARHLLVDGQRFIFLRMAWSRSPLTDLMLCNTMDKEIVTFPPLGRKPLTRENIYNSYAALMIVPRQFLEEELLAPNGKAHACLNGLHDQVPNLKPPI